MRQYDVKLIVCKRRHLLSFVLMVALMLLFWIVQSAVACATPFTLS